MGGMTKGGKREGSGRKRSETKKIRMSCSLAPDVIDYLNSRTDRPKAQVIEDALRFYNDFYKWRNLLND
jgi:predicted DNA-binding protein